MDSHPEALRGASCAKTHFIHFSAAAVRLTSGRMLPFSSHVCVFYFFYFNEIANRERSESYITLVNVHIWIFIFLNQNASLTNRNSQLLTFSGNILNLKYKIIKNIEMKIKWSKIEMCGDLGINNKTPNRMLTRRLPHTKCINASPRIRLHVSIRLKIRKKVK